ncbi:TIGR03943 family putative permease subunit [Streptomyces luteireticuli]|uniref:TIGR03943 family protein n=1 Tax=Streptomyces luteireticuli TaxID=173858 RepID=A0ABN0YYS2_9ACTN
MRRGAQAVLLVLTGAGLLRISLLTDLYLRYVQPGLRPYLVASGVLLILLGALGAARRPVADHGHGHEHGHGAWAAWLLYAPALALLLAPPAALGAYTAARDDGRVAPAAADGRPRPLPARPTIELSLPEFGSLATWGTSRPLAGRTVRLTGFAAPGENGTWYLSRLVITCCAADARVVKVRIHGAQPPPPDTWVAVTGTWHPTGEPGTNTARPALDASAVTRIPPPDDPYQHGTKGGTGR